MSAPAAPKAFVVGPVLAALAAFAFGAGCTDSLSQGPEPTGDAGAPASPTAACIDGKPTRPYPDGPHRIAQGETLPDLTFEGLRGDGTKGPFALRELYEPCAPSAKLAMLRAGCLLNLARAREAGRVLQDLESRGLGANASYPKVLADFREFDGNLAFDDIQGARSFAERVVTLPLHRYVTRRIQKSIETHIRSSVCS